MRAARLAAALVLLSILGASAVHAVPSNDPSTLPASLTLPQGMLPHQAMFYGELSVAAYRAALTHGEHLAQVPCTCGCVASLGHQNNLDCYIDAFNPDGTITFSTHGLNCGVCQLITRDTLAGVAAGMDGPALKAMIEQRYGAHERDP